MPATKISEAERRRRTVTGIINKRLEQSGLDIDALAKRIHVCTQTVRNRRNHPENYTLDELWRVCDVLRVSELERAYIMGVPELERFEQILRE